MVPKLKVAFVGLGRIASSLEDDTKREKPASHAGAFSVLEEVELAAGCDLDPARRETFGQRWGLRALYRDAETMLAEIKPEILVVSTHPDSHAFYIERGIRAGTPVIVAEKPLTDSLHSARKLLRQLERSTTRLLVNHERRYARDYNRVKSLVEEKTYGNLRSIVCKLYMGRGRTPGEVLVWDGTHLIDLLLFLTGKEVKTVWASGNPEMPGATLLVGLTMGKTEVLIELACDRDHLVFELDLSWERGRVQLGNGLYEEFVGDESPLYDNFRSLVKVNVPKEALYPTRYFARMAEDAVRCARDPLAQPVSSGKDGLAALETIDRILRRVGSSLRRVTG
jgi:predicted dehydrogenase